jgi:alpha-mannosidase
VTEIELMESKVAARLEGLEEFSNSFEAVIGPWRKQVAARYLDAGIPPAGEAWPAISPGEVWRPEADSTWFLATAVVPEGWSGGPLIANLEIGGESQVFVNGELRGSVSFQRREIALADAARPGERYELALETARWWTHYQFVRTETFARARLLVPSAEVRDFLYRARLTMEAAFTLPQGGTERMRLIRLLDDVLKEMELRKAGTEEFLAQVSNAARRIERGLPRIGPGGPGNITLVGHAHIDTAWLWPLAETHRKCGRTFSNVLGLMERYPDFRFSQSQPQLYKFTQRLFPEVYARIKERVAAGQWEPMGGAWVECDCNVSGGEALIRQLLYGKRFYRQEFGLDTVVGWWPDAFGYSWALPQILAHCGMKYFFSTKISWNQYNTFPCGLFWWQGIDGTRLLTFHATGTYNGAVTPKELTQFWREFPERDRVDNYLHSFGYGDGGGGPTAEMIERGRRLAGMPGVPKCHFGRTDEFFASAERETAQIPTWNNEMYLELHRACQTTQARTKRGNRKLELALRELELFGTVAMSTGIAPYPREALQEMWENLLCYQFHDILPGSSVNQVYVEAEADYQRMLARAQALRDGLIEAGIARFDTRGEGKAVVVFNALSWERTDPVEVTAKLEGDAFHAVSPSGESTPCQVVRREGAAVTVVFLARVPALGHAVYHVVPGEGESAETICGSESALENARLRVEFDGGGRVTRVFDKEAQREALAPGAKGNLLQLFEDRPISYDAWDIDPWFEDQQWEVPDAESVQVVEAGPVRATLRFRRRTEKSAFVQEVQLCAHSRRVDFVTHADWHERKTLLKVAFPVDVLAPQATYEIQFGAIQRPTHDNTSWDRARFEVPAHRWADLSEAGYGVALLNDCKYGYDVKGNTLRLSLLRSSTDPDPEADQGEHDFTYSLYPHPGGWQEGEVVRRGLELNVPLLAVPAETHAGPGPAQGSLASPDRPNVIVEALKKAEDGDDLILRVYESHGARGPVSIALGLPVKSALECNGMEEATGPADLREGVLRCDVRPWQIRSFRLRV